MEWRDGELPTLEQRVQVMNTYLSYTIWYHAQVLPLPNSFCLEIDKLIRQFLYHDKVMMGKVKLLELCNRLGEGGLGLWDTYRKAAALFLHQSCRVLDRK
jgi:hypothetical protein